MISIALTAPPARQSGWLTSACPGRPGTVITPYSDPRQAIQTCTNVGCFVAMTLSDKLIAAMRTAGELKIAVQDANKKPVEMSLPLLGFGLAFDKAK